MSGAVVRKAEQLRGMRLSRGYKVIRIDEVPPESVRLTLCGRSRWYENDPAYPEPMQMSFAALVEYRNVYGSGGFEGQAFEFLREHGLVGRDAPAVPLTPADRALSYIRTQCPLCEGKGKAWLDTAGLKEILCDGCGRFFVSQELWENLCCEIRTAGDRARVVSWASSTRQDARRLLVRGEAGGMFSDAGYGVVRIGEILGRKG